MEIFKRNCGLLVREEKWVLKSKLLNYLAADTLSYYSGYEMTASLLSASFNFRVFVFFLLQSGQKSSAASIILLHRAIDISRRLFWTRQKSLMCNYLWGRGKELRKEIAYRSFRDVQGLYWQERCECGDKIR